MSDTFFRDYRWVKDAHFPTGKCAGVEPIATGDGAPAESGGCFKFVALADGNRVEQYDADGRFVRVVHDPADGNRGTRKACYQDEAGLVVAAVRLDESGAVRVRETYTFLSDPGEPLPLVKAEIYNADGRLLEVHTPHRIGPAAEDIHVTDALGKLKVVLHHTEMDKGEPCEGRDEWAP